MERDQLSGKREGCVAAAVDLAPRRARPAGRGSTARLALRGSRLGFTQPFWWAILSPCLMTVRSTEARHRVGQQLEVLLPVARRVRPGLHLVDRESQGRAIPLGRGRPELGDDGGPADARRAGHGVT